MKTLKDYSKDNKVAWINWDNSNNYDEFLLQRSEREIVFDFNYNGWDFTVTRILSKIESNQTGGWTQGWILESTGEILIIGTYKSDNIAVLDNMVLFTESGEEGGTLVNLDNNNCFEL